VVVGLVVLLGWGYQVELLEGRARGYVGMNPTTALVLMLAAAALWTQHRVWRSSSRSMLLRCAVGTASVVVVAVGVITLAGYVLGRNLGLDQIAFRTRLVGNRIAPNTGLSFVLVGVALWLLDRPPRWRLLHAKVAALLVIGISGLSLLGYGYGVARMYSVGQYIPMALPTALSFFALGVGVLCARPDHGFASMPSREDPGGVLARRVLPAAILIPAALGWFRVWGHRAVPRAVYEPGMPSAGTTRSFRIRRFVSLRDRTTGKSPQGSCSGGIPLQWSSLEDHQRAAASPEFGFERRGDRGVAWVAAGRRRPWWPSLLLSPDPVAGADVSSRGRILRQGFGRRGAVISAA
jgi:hypothetical protein